MSVTVGVRRNVPATIAEKVPVSGFCSCTCSRKATTGSDQFKACWSEALYEPMYTAICNPTQLFQEGQNKCAFLTTLKKNKPKPSHILSY